MTNLAVVHQSQDLSRPLSAVEVRAQVNLIQEVMKAVMLDGTHFGKIPGTPKPTLYKAGSEKILATFRIGIEPEVIDLSTADEIRYRVLAHAYVQSTGQRLGSGVGEASTNEEKYRWRGAVCQEEWNETPEDRRRSKWQRGYNNGKPTQVNQVRTNPADLANTVLKMAKKRAQIDVTLTVTGASDVFAQDIEDLPAEVREAIGDPEAPAAKPPIQPPQRKAAAPAQSVGQSVIVTIKDVTKKDGQTNNKPWTRWVLLADDGKRYGTFDEAHAAVIAEAREAGQQVAVTFTTNDKGNTITAVGAVEREVGAEG